MKKLGAKDPQLCELFRKKQYRSYIHSEKGEALLKALLRTGSNPNDQTTNGHRALQLAIKLGLEKIVTLLIDAGAE